MTQREIARLCCKIISIYALIRSIESLNNAVQMIWMWDVFQISGSGGIPWENYVGIFFTVAPTVLLVAMTIFFWKNAGIIAAWITGYNIQDEPNEPDSDPKRIGAKDFQVVAFATIGLWAVVSSIAQLFSAIAWAAISYTTAPEDVFHRAFTRVISPLILLCLGFWLLFSARGLVQLLYKLRNVGLEENEQSPSSK